MPDRESPPVLFIIFNRPRTTGPAMETIRAARPKKLYIAADGARNDKEWVKCREARRLATAVDWPCEVKTLFSDINLGCKRGPTKAMNWFFGFESEGIILEDDCLASPSFFPYCAEMLEYYRNNDRVICITGNNFQPADKVYAHSYYYSRYPHCWGWATWSRAWRLYDPAMHGFADCLNWLPSISQFPGFAHFWKNSFNDVYNRGLQSWDYGWALACWKADGIACTPRVNLVSNIGFGPDSTHCPDPKSHWANWPRGEIESPLVHPPQIEIDTEADDYVSTNMFHIPGWASQHVPAL